MKNRGFTLVEMLIAVAIGTVVLLAAVSIVNPLMQMKGHIDKSAGLHMISTYMRECVSNDEAWTNTVQDTANTSMECLRNPSMRCRNRAGGYFRLRGTLLAPGGGPSDCMTNTNTLPTSTLGFMDDGRTCDTFNASIGNDNCPYKFNMYWEARCPSNEAECFNPMVAVIGQMVYEPVNRANRNNPGLNLNRYSIYALRGRADQNRYFVLAETQPQNTPGGICSAGGAYRRFSTTARIDPGSYVREVTADGRILLDPGVYHCRISSPAYMVGNHKALLVNANTREPILLGSNEYAPGFWGFTQTRSEIVGAFVLNVPTYVAVMHMCSALPMDTALHPQTMGVPMNLGLEVYSTMECAVLQRMVN